MNKQLCAPSESFDPEGRADGTSRLDECDVPILAGEGVFNCWIRRPVVDEGPLDFTRRGAAVFRCSNAGQDFSCNSWAFLSLASRDLLRCCSGLCDTNASSLNRNSAKSVREHAL